MLVGEVLSSMRQTRPNQDYYIISIARIGFSLFLSNSWFFALFSVLSRDDTRISTLVLIRVKLLRCGITLSHLTGWPRLHHNIKARKDSMRMIRLLSAIIVKDLGKDGCSPQNFGPQLPSGEYGRTTVGV